MQSFFFKYLVIIGSLHLFVVNFGTKTSAPVSLCGKAMFFTGKKKVKSYGILTDRDFYSVLGKGSVRRQEGNSCKIKFMQIILDLIFSYLLIVT